MCCVGFEPPKKRGSPQAKARRKYGGRPKADERSCRENFIFANSISRNHEFSKNTAQAVFFLENSVSRRSIVRNPAKKFMLISEGGLVPYFREFHLPQPHFASMTLRVASHAKGIVIAK